MSTSLPAAEAAPPPFLTGLRAALVPAVIVGALGYFVDIYDLLLFSIVRVQSLRDLGLNPEQVTRTGEWLFNLQMAGMLVGGVLWGVLGDKRGRVQLLFGSIVMYSLANVANGFVTSVEAYAVLRFIAGVGLAGELGGSVTLVAEVLPKHLRGHGTMIVATVGVFGAVVAALVAKAFEWRTCYFIGGGLGLALLALRMGVLESGMFRRLRDEVPAEGRGGSVARGSFFSLFTNARRFRRYACCVLIGLPTWYVVGRLVAFAPEYARSLGVQGAVNAGDAVLICYLGLTVGDFLSGSLSQWLQSRKRVVAMFLLAAAACVVTYFSLTAAPAWVLYTVIFGLGVTMGYWAVFVTVGAEQFGTNLRATVATTVPNLARGSLNLIAWANAWAASHLGLVGGSLAVGAVCFGIALLALAGLEETYGKDLEFVE